MPLFLRPWVLTMSSSDVVAYIGAAAWLPQILLLIYKAVTRPCLVVMLGRHLQVGLSSLGPLIAIPMSFGAEHKDVVFNSIRVRVSHEGGDSHTFEWYSLGEFMGQISGRQGGPYTFNRDLLPIALKVGVAGLVEKNVRCSDPQTRVRQLSLFRSLVAHVSYLVSSKPESVVAAALESRECFEFREAVRNGIWWKSGRYFVDVGFGSYQKFAVRGGRWEFSLSEDDVREIRRNLDVVEVEMREMIAAKTEGRPAAEQQWVYVYPDVRPARTAM